MSTALPAPAAVRAEPPGGFPRYWPLFRGVAFALFAGTVFLWMIGIALSLLALVRISGTGESAYAPWVIDGPWALLAAIGWGTLVAALFAAVVRERVLVRTGVEISRTLAMASVAIGGYGPWIVTSSATGRVGLALIATPAVLRLATFDRFGAARALPRAFELPRRRLAAVLAGCVVVLLVPYALLHPLSIATVANPSGTSIGYANDGSLLLTQPGKRFNVLANLRAGRFPITVTAVAPIANSGAVRVERVWLTHGFPVPFTPAAALPLHVGAGRSFWIRYAASLTRCPPTRSAGVTRIRVSYRELGLSLTQTVPLDSYNLLLACG